MADPPWPYFGSTVKDGAAGSHYDLMSLDDICSMPVRESCNDKALLLIWATCPRLPDALETIKSWGFYYRGVGNIWIKTRKDGGIISGQGVPPNYIKPTSELLLVGTTCKSGRAFPILTASAPQVVLAPREKHSKKPQVFIDLIEKVCGDRPRIELFARQRTLGWDASGIELDGTDYRLGKII